MKVMRFALSKLISSKSNRLLLKNLLRLSGGEIDFEFAIHDR